MEKLDINGMQLAYQRSGAGVPLVLVHGYPLDHSIWDRVVPLLSGTFDVITPDLRGFGQSGSTEQAYGMEDYAADLSALLDHLEVKQAVLAGHSMGGYVALAFARAFPARVRGLALVSSQAGADSADSKDRRYKSAAEVDQNGTGSVAEAMSAKLSADSALQSFSRDLIARQSPAGLIGALRAMAERSDSTDLLKGFQLPVVLVHGDADALIPVERAREVVSLVPQARLFILEGVGHLPMLEAPEESAAALKHLA